MELQVVRWEVVVPSLLHSGANQMEMLNSSIQQSISLKSSAKLSVAKARFPILQPANIQHNRSNWSLEITSGRFIARPRFA